MCGMSISMKQISYYKITKMCRVLRKLGKMHMR